MPVTVPTVLVLGAGASHAYGFPLGSSLRDRIAAQARSPLYPAAVEPFGQSRREVAAFSRALSHSGYASIDAFLEAEPSFIPLGKLAIALALSPSERSDNLFPPRAPANHWYQHLLTVLDIGKPGWKKNKLTILTFNYDRSLEHYLTTVIAQRRRITRLQAARALRQVEIIHLHGQLGSYPGLGRHPMPYGHTGATKADIRRAANGIRIIAEAGDLAPFIKAGKRISVAERLIFLGFGYASPSMERLEAHTQQVPRFVGGTSRGLTHLDWRRVTRSHFVGHWLPRSRRSVLDYLRADMDLSYNPDPRV